MYQYRYFIYDMDSWFTLPQFKKQTDDIMIRFVVFKDGQFQAYYSGNIAYHGTRAIRTCLRLYNINSYEHFSDKDTDIYEFSTETPDIGEAIIEKMTLIYRREA